MNLVEMFADENDMLFNQRCAHGNLVFGHAVYCHSDDPESPRKCRRTWYTGGAEKDEDCPFFKPNPIFANQAVK
jgi:hypothetical protein